MAVTTANHRHLLLSSIDMSTLSPSELHSLSLLSTSTATASAADTTPANHGGGGGGSLSERDRNECVKIVGFLKKYLRYDDDNPANWRKKKREKDAKIEIVNRNGVVVDLAALEERDCAGGRPFAAELRRLTAERESEEELLEVLEKIEGKWCGTRKKRRIVDACVLSDAFPVGWKVVIALRRYGGRYSPYCRRFVSPTGEHFSSCKEVSSFLKSYFGINDTKLLRDSRGELQQRQNVYLDNLQHVSSKDDTSIVVFSKASTSEACLPVEREKHVSVSGIDNLPDVQVSDLYECHTCNISFHVKDNYLQHLMSTHERTTKRYRLSSPVGNNSSMGNILAIRDANYGCHAPNRSFNVQEKDLEQLPSTEKKKKKKRGIVSTVADGVIMRDGKFECQFCDKAFEERRRYLGHLGNHVKGSIKATRGPPVPMPDRVKTPSTDGILAKISNSKMDALIKIAHNSIQAISPSVPEKVASYMNNIDQISIAKKDVIRNTDLALGKNLSLCVAEHGVEKYDGVEKALSLQLNPCSTVSQTSTLYPTEVRKEHGEVKTLWKELVPPNNKASDMLVKDTEIGDSRPCLDEYEMTKDSAEAQTSASTEVLHSCNEIREKTMTNGIINGSASCHADQELGKEDREEKTTLKLRTDAQVKAIFIADREITEHSYAHNEMDLEYNYCFDSMTMSAVETETQGENSTGNCVVKSMFTKDEESAEESDGRLTIDFLSYNQKPSDMGSSVEKVQSKYIDKHKPGHAQRHENSNLVTVARDAIAVGCSTLPNSSSSPFDEIFGKAGQNICNLDPNLDSGNEFEFMKLDEIEPQMYKYNAMSGDDSIFLPEVSMDLEHDTGFDLEFNASADPESEFPEAIPNRSTITMTCVWCGSEFSHEVVELEPQQDSVGFMCPACRTKISKQFNDLESNFSLNPY
ncbi:hypothetical protein vseg_018611 [Gypsophila vaccaria]